MDIVQLTNNMDSEVIMEIFKLILPLGVQAGFAFGTVLHLTAFAVFRLLAFLNTK